MRFLVFAFLFSSMLYAETDQEEVMRVHRNKGLNRVGYGAMFSMLPKERINVYSLSFEKNDEQKLSMVDEAFKFAKMPNEIIDKYLHDLEIKQRAARRAYEQDKSEEKKKAMDAANRARNSAFNELWLTAQLGPIYHRIVGPNKQLGNVLEEFWFNHFNVSRKSMRFHLQYRRMIRNNIDKTFLDMLIGSSQHPAMLEYLDLRVSRRGAINENYGRELLELHTFGDEEFINYNQADIVAVSKLLTGWRYRRVEVGEGSDILFEFNAGLHDNSSQKMFKDPNSLEIPEGSGVERGLKLLAHLANHPATKNNLCKKLINNFLGKADKDLLSKCVTAWGDKGDLKAVYQSFMGIPDIYNSYEKIPKNAIELVISRERILQRPIDLRFLRSVHSDINQLGINYGDVAPPTGYKSMYGQKISASKKILWHKQAVNKLRYNQEFNDYLLSGSKRFNPIKKFYRAIRVRKYNRMQNYKSTFRPFINKKNFKADIFSTLAFQYLTSDGFMEK